MNPLSALFGAGVATRNAMFDRSLLKQQRLRGPVVSVGNLCVGGTGKTPFTQLLGDLLMQREIDFDVLSRGYGRESTEIKIVELDGSPNEFGDEPLLLAKYFAAKKPENPPRVIVGADRYEAGRFAEQKFGPRLHLLDDGFQHRGLARDFDIVLLAPDDADQVLLPVGRLREPLTALKRAHAVVATDEVKIEAFPVMPPLVWRVERDIALPEQLSRNARVLAFCAIARPHRFFTDLRRHGLEPVAELTFRDHHRYSAADIEKIVREISSSRADCCVTTIKDMMNLGELVHRLAPIYAVRLSLKLRDADAALDEIIKIIERRQG
ncbi:lipid-A-disaccharide kinase [Candidatus Koribacter versatilis Ellin345]|uniref:Tetraacyldisaccharide 4'-kinase n=1 Tax=Koribacter versatilis (strain Ellin345) TaxID=204669 RepID=LPXK_KORVE|nr:tetraacyldisaccharide 4'-kinase [Candidatus Koribacter versatilis]Q1IHD2.1 RecName: Full=Tetraacyldisaccharide 4'-kinase; AltName: Full=Lipid A 4'-kinase [Candidatus Koribacter versatilis Ellin345]ABF43718.1 lipid-A-disaccharide kinase [Candidatus Koribacter versatilis Ellin345]